MSIKIRIAGSIKDVEHVTKLLRSWSKTWGKRKIFRVRKYDRDPLKSMYHKTLGNASRVNYIRMNLPVRDQDDTL